MRCKSRRRLEQAGEHRCFGEVHVARGLVEIKLCRRIDAEGAAAEIGAVEIEFENLVLRQPYLEPQREERFLDFALDGALVRQEQVLGQLLADGGTALHQLLARALVSVARNKPGMSMPKCPQNRRSSVASVALIRWSGN